MDNKKDPSEEKKTKWPELSNLSKSLNPKVQMDVALYVDKKYDYPIDISNTMRRSDDVAPIERILNKPFGAAKYLRNYRKESQSPPKNEPLLAKKSMDTFKIKAAGKQTFAKPYLPTIKKRFKL